MAVPTYVAALDNIARCPRCLPAVAETWVVAAVAVAVCVAVAAAVAWAAVAIWAVEELQRSCRAPCATRSQGQ
jgi:hypothetical protein